MNMPFAKGLSYYKCIYSMDYKFQVEWVRVGEWGVPKKEKERG
jgi:hypothetical protein